MHASTAALLADAPDASVETAPPTPGTNDFAIWGNLEPVDLDLLKDRFPSLTIRQKPWGSENSWKDQWLSALAAGQRADLYVWEEADADWCSDLPLFADLTDPRFDSAALLGALTEQEMRLVRQPGTTTPTRIPQQTMPILLVYRADLVSEVGLEADPEVFGRFIQNPDQWLDLLHRLKERGRYGVEWRDHLISAGSLFTTPFTGDFQWKYHLTRYEQVFETLTATHAEGLVGNISIWDPSGKEALRNGKLAMFLAGPWIVDLLPEWVPDTSGSWRVTRMPLGLSGEWGTRWFGVGRETDHADAAWSVVESACVNYRNYLSAEALRPDPFFGNQRVIALALSLVRERETVRHTPLDAQVSEAFRTRLDSLYAGGVDAHDWLFETEQWIMNTYGADIDRLRALELVQ